MKRFISALLALALTNPVFAAGVDTKFNGSDNIQFGVSSSTDPKSITFNTGDAGSNVTLSVTDSRGVAIATDSSITLDTQSVVLGDGSAADQVLTFDDGNAGNNARIFVENSTGQLKFQEVGASAKRFGSGSGGGLGGTNTLAEDNASFEDGSPPDSWTASGGTFASETTDPLFGLQSGSWDSDGSSQTLSSAAKTITNFDGLIGNRCVAQISYAYPSGTAADYALQAYDGTNVLAAVDLTLTTTGSREAFVVFTCPATGTIQLRLISQVADADPITLDDAFLGSGIREVQVAGADLIAHATYPGTASCVWEATTSSYAAFGTDADCPAITVNESTVEVDTTDDDLPTLIFPSLPAGRYVVMATLSADRTGPGKFALAINDGSDTRGQQSAETVDAAEKQALTLVASFSYLSAGARTFQIYGSSGGTSVRIINNNSTDAIDSLTWTVTRYPLDSEKAITLDQQGSVGTAYHQQDCSFDQTATSFGALIQDASCSFTQDFNRGIAMVTQTESSNSVPGIVFTPNRTGLHKISAIVTCNNGGAGVVQSWEMRDGSSNVLDNGECDDIPAGRHTLVGHVDVTSLADQTISIYQRVNSGTGRIASALTSTRPIRWVVENVELGYQQPIIPDAVKTPGVGTDAVLYAADVTCSGSSAINANPGSWLSAIGNVSSGACAITVNAGIFSNPPICSLLIDGGGGPPIPALVGIPTTTSITIDCANDTGTACGSYQAHLICYGY